MKRLALAGLVAALTITAVALAAPKPGSWNASIGTTTYQEGEGNGLFRVTTGPAIKKVPTVEKIYAPSDFKCNTTGLAVAKRKIPIKNGKFSYTGPAYVNWGSSPPLYKGTLTWKGKFVTRKKAKGTLRFQSPVTPKRTRKGIAYTNKDCDTGTLNWVGKFTG